MVYERVSVKHHRFVHLFQHLPPLVKHHSLLVSSKPVIHFRCLGCPIPSHFYSFGIECLNPHIRYRCLLRVSFHRKTEHFSIVSVCALLSVKISTKLKITVMLVMFCTILRCTLGYLGFLVSIGIVMANDSYRFNTVGFGDYYFAGVLARDIMEVDFSHRIFVPKDKSEEEG